MQQNAEQLFFGFPPIVFYVNWLNMHGPHYVDGKICMYLILTR